jgi:hypothetical protein
VFWGHPCVVSRGRRSRGPQMDVGIKYRVRGHGRRLSEWSRWVMGGLLVSYWCPFWGFDAVNSGDIKLRVVSQSSTLFRASGLRNAGSLGCFGGRGSCVRWQLPWYVGRFTRVLASTAVLKGVCKQCLLGQSTMQSSVENTHIERMLNLTMLRPVSFSHREDSTWEVRTQIHAPNLFVSSWDLTVISSWHAYPGCRCNGMCLAIGH